MTTIAILRVLASRRPGGWAALGLAGAGIATFAAIELELIRLFLARPALTWHVDWRYALNHAQAIAATGGVDSALDYAGAPINYHVGPAWFAGAFERLFGGGMTHVLFGVVPLLSMLTLGIAAVTLLRNHD